MTSGSWNFPLAPCLVKKKNRWKILDKTFEALKLCIKVWEKLEFLIFIQDHVYSSIPVYIKRGKIKVSKFPRNSIEFYSSTLSKPQCAYLGQPKLNIILQLDVEPT